MLVWTSFYEQLAWAPVLVILALQNGDAGVVALAASAYSLANLFGNLLFGALSDRLGRYRVAGAGLLGMAVTGYLHLAAGTPGLLVGARFLHGLTAAAVAPAALAGVSDWAPGGQRGEIMARVGLIIALASMVSTPVNGLLTRRFGPAVPVTTLVVGLVLAGALSFVLGWNLRPAGRPERAVARAPRAARIDPVLAAVAGVVAFALMFGQNVLFYALPLQGVRTGLDPAKIGGLLAAFAVGSAIAFLPPLARISDWWGRRVPLLIGLVVAAGGLLWLGLTGVLWQMAASLFLYGIGFGLVFTAVSALSADAAGAARRGLAFGLLTAAFSVGAVTGPLVASTLEPWLPPFVTAAAVIAVGGLVTAVLYREPAFTGPPASRDL